VIQVALGDYHYVALTSAGEVYTWGKGAQGQLGLGGTEKRGMTDVLEPEKVVFPGEKHGGRCFVFGIAAAGWHTGALVLGDPRKRAEPAIAEEDESVEETVPEVREEGQDGMPGAFPPGQMGNHAGFAPHVFRIGFAGRGGLMGRLATQRGRGRFGTGANPNPSDQVLEQYFTL